MTLLKLEGIRKLLKIIEKRMKCSLGITQFSNRIVIRVIPENIFNENITFFMQLAEKLGFLYGLRFELVGKIYDYKDYFELEYQNVPYKYEYVTTPDTTASDFWKTSTTADYKIKWENYSIGKVLNFDENTMTAEIDISLE